MPAGGVFSQADPDGPVGRDLIGATDLGRQPAQVDQAIGDRAVGEALGAPVVDQAMDFPGPETMQVPGAGIAADAEMVDTAQEILQAGRLTVGRAVAVVLEQLAELVVGARLRR